MHTGSTGNLHQNGVPVHATDEEPMGMPTSDRHQSETASHESGGDADAAKHDHNPPEP